eukprot:TRINITY_DN2244_c0_g1_i1.p1 TRINITY_DN2244_c0_g1~~TRINITY_DN2244_c0_g1_i1.p1  ORF type:complete len:156 (-),score=29.13 TRINITY_DN2244_c0_g1_i1:77-544(-)
MQRAFTVFVVALAFAAALLAGVDADAHWQNCGKPSDLFKVQTLTLNPPQPVAGKNLTINIHGLLTKPVTSGKITFTVFYESNNKWQQLPTSPYYFNICDVTSCPVKAGPKSFIQSVFIPSFTPTTVPYKGNCTIYDQAVQEVTCISYTTNIAPGL